MKVRITRNLGADLPKYFVDQIVDIDGDVLESLLAQKLAEPFEEIELPEIQAVPQESIKAVPPKAKKANATDE